MATATALGTCKLTKVSANVLRKNYPDLISLYEQAMKF